MYFLCVKNNCENMYSLLEFLTMYHFHIFQSRLGYAFNSCFLFIQNTILNKLFSFPCLFPCLLLPNSHKKLVLTVYLKE